MRFPPQAVMGGSSPCIPEPGDFSRGCRPASAENDPLDHFPGASALLDLIERQTCRRYASGLAAESRHPGCKASRESPGISSGKSSLSPELFPGFLRARSPLSSRLPKPMADVAAFSESPRFARCRSREVTSLAQMREGCGGLRTKLSAASQSAKPSAIHFFFPSTMALTLMGRP